MYEPDEKILERLHKLQNNLLEEGKTTFKPVMNTKIQAAGFHLLGVGSSRIALQLKNNVIAKIAFSERGLRDNVVEWHIYNFVDQQTKNLLSEIFCLSEEHVVFMKQCIPINFTPSNPSFQEIMRMLAQAGIADVSVNLGIEDEWIVCYDYAQASSRLLADSLH